MRGWQLISGLLNRAGLTVHGLNVILMSSNESNFLKFTNKSGKRSSGRNAFMTGEGEGVRENKIVIWKILELNNIYTTPLLIKSDILLNSAISL